MSDALDPGRRARTWFRDLRRMTLLDLMVDVFFGSLALSLLLPRFAAIRGLGLFLPTPIPYQVGHVSFARWTQTDAGDTDYYVAVSQHWVPRSPLKLLGWWPACPCPAGSDPAWWLLATQYTQ